MKRLMYLLSLAVFLACAAAALPRPAQIDLSGTWEGTAQVPNVADLDKITMVLEKSGETYTGRISDSVGYATDAKLENVEFKENKLSFSFQIFSGSEYQGTYVSLNVEGNRMSGSWQDDSGSSGAIVLEKQPPA
ncbi:MAG: hypothetical protein AB1715_01305 [Acidobacteriota bacterium]